MCVKCEDLWPIELEVEGAIGESLFRVIVICYPSNTLPFSLALHLCLTPSALSIISFTTQAKVMRTVKIKSLLCQQFVEHFFICPGMICVLSLPPSHFTLSIVCCLIFKFHAHTSSHYHPPNTIRASFSTASKDSLAACVCLFWLKFCRSFQEGSVVEQEMLLEQVSFHYSKVLGDANLFVPEGVKDTEQIHLIQRVRDQFFNVSIVLLLFPSSFFGFHLLLLLSLCLLIFLDRHFCLSSHHFNRSTTLLSWMHVCSCLRLISVVLAICLIRGFDQPLIERHSTSSLGSLSRKRQSEISAVTISLLHRGGMELRGKSRGTLLEAKQRRKSLAQEASPVLVSVEKKRSTSQRTVVWVLFHTKWRFRRNTSV